jgi:signal transduction histidine kinase
MSEFYLLPTVMRIVLSILSILCVMASALMFILLRYRFARGLTQLMESALALLVLFQATINTALCARAQLNIYEGFITHSGYTALRYAVFAAIAVLFIFFCAKKKPFIPGTALIASFLTLPVTEAWAGSLFPAAFTLSLLILFAGEVWMSSVTRRELYSSISGLSVKQAMDSLNTAIMFYRKNGHILLMNDKMRELMVKTAGSVMYNGKLFIETEIAPKCGHTAAAHSGSYLLRMPDSVWKFTESEITPGRTAVTRLTATDVTEQDNANALLLERQRELYNQQAQLKELVENIEKIRRSEELQRIGSEFHNAQNLKLTLLLRYLRQGTWPAGAFTVCGRGWFDGMIESSGAADDPRTDLDALAKRYRQAGVSIVTRGELPSGTAVARVLIYILREAASNAIIHGYADEVYVKFTDNGETASMNVTDNSELTPGEIREGTGIPDMRRRAAEIGGSLDICAAERFTLNVTVPLKKGEAYE